MNGLGLVLVVASLLASCASFIWVALNLQNGGGGKKAKGKDDKSTLTDAAEEETSHLFNKEFREELRNHGRLRFESIIEENAMFLQQDLRLTTSQLNDYMKQQISSKLDTEFKEYTKAMHDLQEMAEQSLKKTIGNVEEQRAAFTKTLEDDVAKQKDALMKAFEANMAGVIEHYVAQSLGDRFDLKAQLPYIVDKMKETKADMIKDINL